MGDERKVTICIPCAGYHKDILQRAISSATNQTVECTVKYLMDTDGNGAGWTRNRLLETVDTEYVVFLDADDWLDETFVAQCLRAILPGRYAYTDWRQGAELIKAPDKPWCNGSWHVITSLIRTEDAQAVGGFNEDLAALEDTDFYLKLTTEANVCGVHVPKALFHYSKDGQRSRVAVQSGESETIRQELLSIYGGRMGCCGGSAEIREQFPIGEKQPGDVLATALWKGNRVNYGRATGRVYPRMSYPKTTWVDPHDIEIRKQDWQAVIETEPVTDEPYTGIEGFAQAMEDGGLLSPVEADYTPIIAVEKPSPDISAVVEIARGRLG